MNEKAPVEPGDLLDEKYRVDRVLGHGAMGVVVAATHVTLGQRVALKFLLPAALAKPAIVARFKQEGLALVKLRGEHVTKVLDVGSLPSGAPYLVMEYLEGQDLGAMIEAQGSLPVSETMDYLLQTCEAIAEAHALGIVHRDLKPANLFVTRAIDGAPLLKVLDFGISKMADNSLTQTSEIMGSPNYMSPEQLMSAKEVDARTDIWSMGIILFESLTGAVPFEAEGLPQLCTLITTGRPTDLSALRPEISHEVGAVIRRCLEKTPAARYQSIGELAAALAPFAGVHGRHAAERAQSIGGSFTKGRSAHSSGALPIPEPSRPRPADSSSDAFAPTALGDTAGSWMSSSGLAARKKRAAIPRNVAMGVAAALVLGGGVFAFRQSGTPVPAHRDHAETSLSSVTAANPPRANDLTANPESTLTTAPSISASAIGAAAVPSVTASVPAPYVSAHAKPKNVAPLTRKPGPDELPGSRK